MVIVYTKATVVLVASAYLLGYKDTCVQAKCPADVTGGLLGRWMFHGDGTDSLGNYPAQMYNVEWVTGPDMKPNHAVRFKGISTSYATIDHGTEYGLQFAGAFTWCAYVKNEAAGMVFEYFNLHKLHIWFTSTDTFFINSGYGFIDARTASPTGAWHFRCVSYDGSKDNKLRMTEDGQNIGGFNIANKDFTQFTTASPVQMAGVRAGNGRVFRGAVSCMSLYNRSLDTEEIMCLMKACDGVTRVGDVTTGLMAQWMFRRSGADTLGQHDAVTNDVNWVTGPDGMAEHAVQFKGLATSYANVDHGPTYSLKLKTAYTWCAYVKSAGVGPLVEYGTAGHHHIWMNPAGALYAHAASARVQSVLDLWHFLCITFDSGWDGLLRMTEDLLPIGRITLTGHDYTASTSAGPLRIAVRPGDHRTLAADISCMSLYSRGLTVTDLQRLRDLCLTKVTIRSTSCGDHIPELTDYNSTSCIQARHKQLLVTLSQAIAAVKVTLKGSGLTGVRLFARDTNLKMHMCVQTTLLQYACPQADVSQVYIYGIQLQDQLCDVILM